MNYGSSWIHKPMYYDALHNCQIFATPQKKTKEKHERSSWKPYILDFSLVRLDLGVREKIKRGLALLGSLSLFGLPVYILSWGLSNSGRGAFCRFCLSALFWQKGKARGTVVLDAGQQESFSFERYIIIGFRFLTGRSCSRSCPVPPNFVNINISIIRGDGPVDVL